MSPPQALWTAEGHTYSSEVGYPLEVQHSTWLLRLMLFALLRPRTTEMSYVRIHGELLRLGHLGSATAIRK